VYFFDTENNGFGSAWLVKKTTENKYEIKKGTWDAIHVVTTNVDQNKKAKYRVNSSVFFIMTANNIVQGDIDVAGNVNRVKEDYVAINPKEDIQQFHLKNIGKLIEANESEIRSEMHGIFINKSKQIINTGRLQPSNMSVKEKSDFQKELIAMMHKNKEEHERK